MHTVKVNSLLLLCYQRLTLFSGAYYNTRSLGHVRSLVCSDCILLTLTYGSEYHRGHCMRKLQYSLLSSRGRLPLCFSLPLNSGFHQYHVRHPFLPMKHFC